MFLNMLMSMVLLQVLCFRGNSKGSKHLKIESSNPNTLISSLRMQSGAKVELMGYILSNVKLGEPYEESIGLNVESKITELISAQTEESIKNSLVHLEGEWLTIYSTLPTLFKNRLPLFALSANTFKSMEPLMMISSVGQHITKISDLGIYQYNNIVEFQASRENSPVGPIASSHITRGVAKFEDGSNIRLDVAFYENEVTSKSNELKTLFGFTDGDSLLRPRDSLSYSDILYLDEDLRIMKGAKNNTYVLKRC
jgi:hypothetical protein